MTTIYCGGDLLIEVQIPGESSEMRRGPRFPFSADAEIVTPTGVCSGRVIELSFHGCYLEPISTPTLQNGTDVTIKILRPDEYFEATATVLYSRPMLGVGLAFRSVNPALVPTIRRWLLEALDNGSKDSLPPINKVDQ
jgi:hypothetical protein